MPKPVDALNNGKDTPSKEAQRAAAHFREELLRSHPHAGAEEDHFLVKEEVNLAEENFTKNWVAAAGKKSFNADEFHLANLHLGQSAHVWGLDEQQQLIIAAKTKNAHSDDQLTITRIDYWDKNPRPPKVENYDPQEGIKTLAQSIAPKQGGGMREDGDKTLMGTEHTLANYYRFKLEHR